MSERRKTLGCKLDQHSCINPTSSCTASDWPIHCTMAPHVGATGIRTRDLPTRSIFVVTAPVLQRGLLLALMVGPWETLQRSPTSHLDGQPSFPRVYTSRKSRHAKLHLQPCTTGAAYHHNLLILYYAWYIAFTLYSNIDCTEFQ